MTVCQILENPGALNHKLIRVSGIVSRGFEQFTLTDPSCETTEMIWIELGGTQGSEVMYAGGMGMEPERRKPLVVDGVQTTIARDSKFQEFQRLTNRKGGGEASVTVVGRYFSGEKTKLPGGTFWMGYGHLGMGTLLVIQRVVEASPP